MDLCGKRTRGFPMKGTVGKAGKHVAHGAWSVERNAQRSTLYAPRSTAFCRAFVVALVLAVLAVTSRPGLSQSPGRELVADVIVVGNRTIPTEKIMRYIKTRPKM